MKNITNGALLFLLMAAGLLSSCYDSDYLVYDASQNGIYFTKDTLTYSFGVTPVEVRTNEFRIPVRIMGKISKESRTFGYTVVSEHTAAEDGVQYSIGTPIIPADSTDGYIPITIYRDNLEGDYTNGYTRYKLTLRLIDDGFFTPTLDSIAQTRTLSFDNAVEQPEWFDYKGDKVWYESEWGVWHPLKLIKMVEFFHAIEDILPETYKKMATLYGDNLENVPFGDFHVYKTVMLKYVYGPMYEYFNNPDNRDEILSLYADFPFDFPNPYGS